MNEMKPTLESIGRRAISHDTLSLRSIEAELARQDEQLATLEAQIQSLGDVQLAVPDDFFEAIDAIAEAPLLVDPETLHLSLIGIRA